MSKPVYIKILLLSVLALVLACKKEVDSPSSVPEVQTVHYKASVQTEADTKATVGTDLKYKYEAGDRVYMESEDGKLYGFLSMVVDAPGNDVALFEGDLNYVGETPSAEYINSNPAVKLVLVSKDDYLHTITEGKVVPVDAESYPKDKWASSLEDVVSHLSHFTGTGYFKDYIFTLNQQSSFLKCFVRLKSDEAPVNSTITAQLQDEGGDILREASIDVKEAGVVPFVFAFLGGESLAEDTKLLVKWGKTPEDEKSFDVSSATLAANNFYSVSRTTLEFDGFHIKAISNNTKITFNYNYDDSCIEYSLDFGESWIHYTAPFTLNKDEVACIKGNRTDYKNEKPGDTWWKPQDKPIFVASAKCYIGGNIMSLLKDKTLSVSAFQGAFSRGDTRLTYIDIDPDSPLILPATNLVERCYMSMFRNCTSLTRTPVFRVEKTAEKCCYNMFRACSALVNVSDIELPAMELSMDCYRELFRECSQLKTCPVLPAPTLVKECYRQMFSKSGITTIVCLATDISAELCLDQWMSDVAGGGTFYKSPSMEGWPRSQSGIPSNWTVQDYNTE
ncbi:MAG: hypothetical protein E7109_08460 [Bacteroidales bacterium]|nr:hypothetical protein [Bacteroidales bacterium]